MSGLFYAGNNMNMSQYFEILDEEKVADGFFQLNRYRLRHTSYHGGWCEEIVRERLEGLSAASALMYDPLRDQVVLIEQFRVGLMGQEERPFCLETVSGFCDKMDESPEDVAIREVAEEANLTVKQMHAIGDFYISPGFSVEKMFLYCAWVDASKAGGIHGLREEGEEIKVVVMSRQEAMKHLFTRVQSTSLIMCLQWLELNHEELLSEWGFNSTRLL